MHKIAAEYSFRTAKEKLSPFISTRRNSLITLYLPVSGTLPPLSASNTTMAVSDDCCDINEWNLG